MLQDTNVTSSILSPVFSHEVRRVLVLLNFGVLSAVVGLFGIVTNIINIVVFIKQGFSDTVNISFLSLAIADLGALLPLPWMAISVNPWFLQADLPFNPSETISLTGGHPHVCFTRITGWITAFVAFERCLCIAIPLKVKRIITRRVVIAVNVTIFICAFLSMLPVYTTSYHGWKYFPEMNKTLLGILYTDNMNEVQGISLFITDLTAPFCVFTMVLLCTVIIRVKLVQKVKWRQTASGVATSKGELPTKEKKVVVMVTTISAIFIVCFTPVPLLMTARCIEPELSVIGRYANMNWVLFSTAFVIESLNSSVNIFVYYRMSSKYKEAFNEVFKRGTKT
ncbi:somatostatin receptor type 2-like [Aplysia californica]|uniref:Somatostatin receptor type 2-like n=1 Tax=Aplysia californica TaxID=6500 RepID=A0ABM1AE40_APLCA|nr:somatostatin receptor type 2-like [Aplysia californica]